MAYSKEQEYEHKSRIRRILVMKPSASIREVKAILEDSRPPVKIDKDYINKLIKEIRIERAKRLDDYTVTVVLAKFQDEVEELKARLWMIINDGNATYQSKISAIRELRNSSKDLFDKMFDAGVFKRQLGEGSINLTDIFKAINSKKDGEPMDKGTD